MQRTVSVEGSGEKWGEKGLKMYYVWVQIPWNECDDCACLNCMNNLFFKKLYFKQSEE